jgi:hypothetical protein
MSGEELTKAAEKGLDQVLKPYQLDSLFISYVVASNDLDAKSMTRAQLVKKLKKLFPIKLLTFHQEYTKTLPHNLTESLDYYQGSGYDNVNMYMRTGFMRKIYFFNESPAQEIANYVSDTTFGKRGTQRFLENELKATKKKTKGLLEKQKTAFTKTVACISHLMKIIQGAPRTETPFTVYRGERDFELQFIQKEDPVERSLDQYRLRQLGLKEGDTFSSVGFNSFSLAVWTARRFMGESMCCMYRLVVTKDVPFYMFPDSETFKEFEVLLPPAEFKVTKVHNIQSPLSPEIKMRLYDIELVKVLSAKKAKKANKKNNKTKKST